MAEQEFQSFLQEKTKERPLNKKKLGKRAMVTIGMAVLFGLVASLTFFLLEPLYENWLHPETPVEIIEIPEETEDTLPEDLLVEEVQPVEIEQVIPDAITSYRDLYVNLGKLSNQISKSLVTVTGVSQNMDWFNDAYESKDQTSGLLIADNGKELLVLVHSQVLQKAEDIHVTFEDGTQLSATVKEHDYNTNLSVLAVSKEGLGEEFLEKVEIATLGSSRPTSLLGSPVIALGRPFGNQASVAYGMVTSLDTTLNLIDSNYKLLTTDIYGSDHATGILVNLSGEVLGVIDQSFNTENKNLISAIGITELKRIIETMSNGKAGTYLGVHGTDVTPEAHEKLGVPLGAYITNVEMNSPAMNAGIQNGDIITEIKDTTIHTFQDYSEKIRDCFVGQILSIKLMRQSQNEFHEIELMVTVEEQK